MAEPRTVVLGQECPHCGCAMWYWKEKPIFGQAVRAKMAYTHEKSGTLIVDGEYPRCQWCGRQTWSGYAWNPAYLKNFYYENGELAETLFETSESQEAVNG